MSASLLARLIEAGLPAGLIAEVAQLEARADLAERTLEGRRSAERTRKREQRKREGSAEAMSRDITGRSVTSGDGADTSPLDKKAPQTPKEIIPPISPTDDADASSLPPAGADCEGQGDQGSAGAEPAKPKRKASKRKSDRKSASRLPAEWQAPPVDDLPLEVQAMVRQWPSGAYDITALAFRNHWLAEGRAIGAKRDWSRTWCNWLIREHSNVMRAAKAGVRYDAPKPASPADQARDTAANAALAEIRKQESSEARAIRERLKDDAGQRTYDGWIRSAAILIEGDEVTVLSVSRFLSDWLEQHFGATILAVARGVTGRPVSVFFRVAQPPLANAA